MNYKPIIEFIRSLYPGQDTIPLHEPLFTGNEKKYLLDCIDSTFVSSVGKYVNRFEDMVHEYTGAQYAVATMNGTAALHVALLLSGVQRGDLVITQPFTFIATCNAIAYCGAEPIFIDIDRKTLGLSPDALEDWLSTNTIVNNDVCYFRGVNELSELSRESDMVREHNDESEGYAKSRDRQESGIGGLRKISACVPMHTFGHPCEIDRIVEICRRYHILVVEDAAEAIGSYYHGQHTGTFGKLGILSFNGNKTITTGGGGMILTDDPELGRLAKHITTTAKKAHPWEFVHDMTGYNFRLPNVNAALGCAQMEMLASYVENKRATAREYSDFFSSMPGIEFISEPLGCRSNYWLNSVLFDSSTERDEFLKVTHSCGVTTRPAWMLMNRLAMYSKALHGKLTVADDIASRLVNLPSSVRIFNLGKKSQHDR